MVEGKQTVVEGKWFKRIGQANAPPAGLMGAVCSRSARGLPAALHLRTASGQGRRGCGEANKVSTKRKWGKCHCT